MRKSKLPERQLKHINTYLFLSQAFFEVFFDFFQEFSENFSAAGFPYISCVRAPFRTQNSGSLSRRKASDYLQPPQVLQFPEHFFTGFPVAE